MLKIFLKLGLWFAVFAISILTFSPKTDAVLTSCSVSVSPNTVTPSTEQSFSFNVDNPSANAIVFVTIYRPSANFSITGYSASGWSTSGGSTEVSFFNGSIASGGSGQFSVSALTGGSEATSANWTISVSDASNGAGSINCTGNLGTAIEGSVPDIAGPIIDNLEVLAVTTTSVTISWTTDETSDSVVKYDPNDTYSLTATGTSNTTSHTVNLTGLTANTTYYYNACSTDASGNERCDSGNSFTTAATSTSTASTPTPTPTSISSSSTTATATPTPKLTDKTAPIVSLDTDFSEPFKDAPKITGRASDTGIVNAGVVRVDYSIDDGKNWLPADDIKGKGGRGKGEGQSSVEFEFTPFIFEDGNYSVKVRAFDASGNIGVSRTYTLVIDRLPPQVGGSIFSVGAQILSPTQEGFIFTLPGLATKITLSAVGGPTEIDIVSKLKSQNSKVKNAETMHSLVKNPDSGLWSGGLNFREAGVYTLLAKSVDGAGNKTERRLNTFIVLPNGLVKNSTNGVIKDAVISIYYLEPTFKNFVLWDGTPYGQTNPQKTKEDGAYSFYLPPGKYYLQINAFGFKNLKTNIFEIDKNLPITKDFTLERSASLTFGPLTIPLPSFSQTDVTVDFKIGAIPSEVELESTVTGAQFPQFSSVSANEQFSITDLFGKPTIITFLNSWSPLTSEQISISEGLLERDEINLITIFPQESISKISLFQKRGDYKLILLADPDGELVEPLGIHSLPTHIFLDRRGIITNTKVGVLSEEELREGIVGSD